MRVLTAREDTRLVDVARACTQTLYAARLRRALTFADVDWPPAANRDFDPLNEPEPEPEPDQPRRSCARDRQRLGVQIGLGLGLGLGLGRT